MPHFFTNSVLRFTLFNNSFVNYHLNHSNILIFFLTPNFIYISDSSEAVCFYLLISFDKRLKAGAHAKKGEKSKKSVETKGI